METCANPGCDQPGTNKCSACKTTPYCGPICQTADWALHKEVCPGHLRKVGMAHLEKALGFRQENNWPQTLRHADVAATKLKQLKDHPVEDIDDVLNCKCDALGLMGRYKEALECAKQRYCLYLTSHTHPPAIEASFQLIQCCVFNKEFFDAALYARTVWETITLSRNSHIPDDLREEFTARGALELARALLNLAEHGDMPPEEQREAGVEAIMLARRALENYTQLHGAMSHQVGNSMGTLSGALEYFKDVDDDEVLRLFEQSKAIFARVYGSSSQKAATGDFNLASAYHNRARRAHAAHDLDGCVANAELALPHFREAARIFRAANNMDNADQAEREVVTIENMLREVTGQIAARASKG